MSKRTLVLIVLAGVLLVVYVISFTDLFRPPTIRMQAVLRPSRTTTPPTDGSPGVYPVSFTFEKTLELTEVKVVALEDAKTNKYPHAVWHLVSDSNSIPIKAIIYGWPIRGMKPKIAKTRPEPLDPEVPYRLYVTAGKAKGHIDFKTKEVVRPNTRS